MMQELKQTLQKIKTKRSKTDFDFLTVNCIGQSIAKSPQENVGEICRTCCDKKLN